MSKVIHTFVVLAYKESRYLEECINSVLNQKYKSKVVIATSTPNNYISSLAKKYNLKIIENKNPKGIGSDFDFALNQGNTVLVTIAHQDDIYDYDYSYEIVKKYEENKDSLIIFPDYYEIKNDQKVFKNVNLKIKRFLLFPLRFSFLNKIKFIKRRALSLGCSIGCPSVTFQKKLIEIPLFDYNFKCDIDWHAWETLSRKKGNFSFINKPLMGHRVHEESTTTEIISDNIRTKEDLIMFKRFWPNFIAKRINKIYSKSEINNNLEIEKNKSKKNFNLNNFSSIKFLAALLVILSHSFSITRGNGIVDPLYEATNSNLSFGSIAVAIFFFLSGFFISKSLIKESNWKKFFKKRILRIFPSLIFVLFITSFVIGPIFTDVSLSKYFTSMTPYLYFIRNSFLFTTHQIIGVFTNNPYNLSINGALWTLPLEFICYIICYFVFKVGLLGEKKLKFTFLPVLIIYILASSLFSNFVILKVVVPLFLLFYMGTFYYTYREKIRTSSFKFIMSIFLLFLCVIFKKYDFLLIIILPYFIYSTAYIDFKFLNIIYPFSKFTYELYLVGFLIQQMLLSIFNMNINVYLHFILSVFFSLFFAIFINKTSKIFIKKLKL